MPVSTRKPAAREVGLARVLVVNDDLTSRLTLKTVLEAGGYAVDAVGSEAEALGKLDQFQYELVLSDSDMDAPHAAQKVLAHARLMEYEPATALFTTYRNRHPDAYRSVFIKPEDLPDLLGKIADLISQRAARLVQHQLARQA
jgi:CheY-like chemotaxis protein